MDPEYSEYGLTQWLWLVRHRHNFKLGNNVEIGNFTVIGCEYGVEIEDDVRIGYNCVIMSCSSIDSKHGKITIKKGASIGAHSTIMPGVTIGEHSIVGAHSFVNKDIPEKCIAYGVPAKVQRPRDIYEIYAHKKMELERKGNGKNK